MDYELAKQLKDAGFPQGAGKYMTHPYPEGESIKYQENTNCYIPTLSELIEACGERFLSLHNLNKDYWEAEAFKDLIPTGRIHEVGTSPELVVAKLWLELNKSK